MTLTPTRAREVIASQSHWPYWGNYSKFLTTEEEVHVADLFVADPKGSTTFATIVHRIARSKNNA